MWQIVSHSALLYMVVSFFLSTLQHGSLINLKQTMKFDQSAIEFDETDPDALRLKINFLINYMLPFVMCCVSNILHRTRGNDNKNFRFAVCGATVCNHGVNHLLVSGYYDVTHFITLLILSRVVFFGTSLGCINKPEESTSPTTRP